MFWYEGDVKQLESTSAKLAPTAETLFYGSSSMRMWTSLDKDMEDLKPANLGFGGSTLAACAWFFERIMLPYHPKKLVIYAGDNDLGDGRHPEEVFLFFQELTHRIEKRFGDIPCYFISLKPSIARWQIVGQFKYTNELIAKEITTYLTNWHYIDIYSKMLDDKGNPKKDLYADDGLHLSANGYRLWAQIVRNALNG